MLLQRHLATFIFLWSYYSYINAFCLREIWGVLGNTLGLQKWNSFLQGYLVVMSPRQKKHTMLYGAATGPSGKINRNRHNVLDRLSARFWWFLLILFFFLWAMKYESWRYTTIPYGVGGGKKLIYTYNCSIKLEGKCWKKAFMFKIPWKMISFDA